MKVIVVHGDHITKSYARLTQFIETAKSRGWEIIEDKLEVVPSLFGTERLIIFRGYSKLNNSDLKNLPKFPGTLVIYHEGTIPQLFLKALPKETKIELFELPKIIWNFLDVPSVKLMHQIITHEPIEFVFALLSRRFRDIYWVKTDPKSFSGNSWFASKLVRQGNKYTPEELKEIIGQFAKIDIDVKTSKADLLSALDLLLISKLK